MCYGNEVIMSRIQIGLMWAWVLFETISGFIFNDESWVFKLVYFFATAIPFWLLMSFFFISQLVGEVRNLEHRINQIESARKRNES